MWLCAVGRQLCIFGCTSSHSQTGWVAGGPFRRTRSARGVRSTVRIDRRCARRGCRCGSRATASMVTARSAAAGASARWRRGGRAPAVGGGRGCGGPDAESGVSRPTLSAIAERSSSSGRCGSAQAATALLEASVWRSARRCSDGESRSLVRGRVLVVEAHRDLVHRDGATADRRHLGLSRLANQRCGAGRTSAVSRTNARTPARNPRTPQPAAQRAAVSPGSHAAAAGSSSGRRWTTLTP